MLIKFPALKNLHLSDFFILFISSVFFLVLYSSCNNNERAKPTVGEDLAKKYCSKCHAMVDPSLLDKAAWKNGVLPVMATKLGIRVYGANMYVNDGVKTNSVVSFSEWSAIVDYYETSAPEHLIAAKRPDSLIRDWSVFELKKCAVSRNTVVYTTLAAFDSSSQSIYTGDGNTHQLTRWNSNLLPADSISLGSPPSYAYFFKDSTGKSNAVFTTLGTIKANNISEGKVLQMNLEGKLKPPADTIASLLPRPVQSVPADINKDGLTDWIVAGFGHDRGGLYWYEHLHDGKYKENVIMDIPGALQTITGDYNNDGWTDLMVLFGAADECIRLFLNDQKGGFTQQKILSFPALYGSSSFQLADFNKDGLPDILYTCGDNNDYSTILKPYHGMYIYLNQGGNKYRQAYFYPINGCTKAIAADFDLDGDLDIATIAFYADFNNNPAEKFIYFEQDKPLHFLPHSPPLEKYGRWLCMDVKDYDHDGDPDILLGNFAPKFITEKTGSPDWDLHLPFIILENKKLHK